MELPRSRPTHQVTDRGKLGYCNPPRGIEIFPLSLTVGKHNSDPTRSYRVGLGCDGSSSRGLEVLRRCHGRESRVRLEKGAYAVMMGDGCQDT